MTNCQKNEDTFFAAAAQVTQAGEILERAGFKNDQIVEMQSAFLALMMAESRIVRHYRQRAIKKVFDIFGKEGRDLILRGLELANKDGLTKSDFYALAERTNSKCVFFNDRELDSVLSSMITHAAYALEKDGTKLNVKPVYGIPGF